MIPPYYEINSVSLRISEMAAETISHPYWPRDLSIPNYTENERAMLEIVTFLFSVSGLLMLLAWTLTGKSIGGERLGSWRRLALCWFTVCGFIHGVIEGWFSLYYAIIPGDQSFLSQLCEWILKPWHFIWELIIRLIRITIDRGVRGHHSLLVSTFASHFSDWRCKIFRSVWVCARLCAAMG